MYVWTWHHKEQVTLPQRGSMLLDLSHLSHFGAKHKKYDHILEWPEHKMDLIQLDRHGMFLQGRTAKTMFAESSWFPTSHPKWLIGVMQRNVRLYWCCITRKMPLLHHCDSHQRAPLLNLANRCFISDTSGNENDHNYIFLASTCMFDWFLLCVHWPGALVQIRGSILGSSLQVLKLSIYMTCIYGTFRRGWNKALFLTTWPVLPADFIKSNYLRSSHKNRFIIHIQRAVITNGLMRTPFDILD